MFVRTVETLAGGGWTGADALVDVFDPVDVHHPFGGFREQGAEALTFCTPVKTVAIRSGR
jgi:aldehyde dehydrogenase (NAD+)